MDLFDDIATFQNDPLFERFMAQSKNVACIGCGEAGLEDYIIHDEHRGIVSCPKCNYLSSIKAIMKTWVMNNE